MGVINFVLVAGEVCSNRECNHNHCYEEDQGFLQDFLNRILLWQRAGKVRQKKLREAVHRKEPHLEVKVEDTSCGEESRTEGDDESKTHTFSQIEQTHAYLL